MLSVKPFRQRPGFCGPASLKMVLSYFGVEKNENDLAKLSGCSKAEGVGAKGIVKAAKSLSFRAFVRDFSGVEDIKGFVKKGIPVIVDWFSADEGHYSVVTGIDQRKIYLQDPELGRLRVMKLDEFKRVWFDFPGRFLRSKNDIIIRRMIVVHRR